MKQSNRPRSTSRTSSRSAPSGKSGSFASKSDRWGGKDGKRFYPAKPKKDRSEGAAETRPDSRSDKPRSSFPATRPGSKDARRFGAAKPGRDRSEGRFEDRSTSERGRPSSSKPKRGAYASEKPSWDRSEERVEERTESRPNGHASRYKGKSTAPFTKSKYDSRTDKRVAPERPGRGRPEARSENRSESRPSFSKDKPTFSKPRQGARDEKRFTAVRPSPRVETPLHPSKATDALPVKRAAGKKPDRETDLIWGIHAGSAALLNPKRRVLRMWLTEAGLNTLEASLVEAKDLLLKRPDHKLVERSELDVLIPPGSVHQGILLECAPLPEPTLHDLISGDKPPDLLLMLDQVTDPHNVGAILRSAAAFGAGAVIMTERNAPGSTGVLAKSASGAAEHVPQIHVVNLARALDDLQQAGYWCVGLAEEGEKEIGDLDLSGRTVLVLGAEGEGLRQLTRKKCNELARLPTGGPVGSLNVSNAAAVGLYEVRRQKNKF